MEPGEADHGDGPQDREHCDRHEQRREHVGEQACGGQRGDQHLAANLLAARCGWIRLAAAGPQQRVQADELEPPRSQLRDEAFEGRHGLRAVAAAVVHQHHAAAVARRRRVADDLVDAGAPPILRVVVRERDHVALLRDLRIAPFLLRIDRVRRGGVRRSDEARPDPRGARDRALGHRDLEVPERSGRGEVGMAEGVVADLEAIPVKVGDHTRVLDDVLPDGEEGRRHAETPQRVRDLGRPARVGAVVEGEGEALSDRLLARDQPAVRAGDPQGGVRLQRPRPAGRGRRRSSARAGAVHREALRQQQQDQRAHEQAEDEPVGGRPLDLAREPARRARFAVGGVGRSGLSCGPR